MEPKFSSWISNEKNNKVNEKYGAPAPYFRKLFSAKNVSRATLYITAKGVFKVFLNGKELCEDRLQPEWTDYSKSLNFVRYDITDKIEGQNCIGVVLGNGWYCGTVGLLNVRANYASSPSFSAEIHLEKEDGVEVICTDQSWKTATGKIVYNDLLHGEYHDFNRDLGDFSSISYEDALFYPSVCSPAYDKSIREHTAEKITLMEQFEGKRIVSSSEFDIYDFGQNFAGIPVIKVRGERGSKIRLRFGEMLDGETLYTANLREAEATDYMVLSGGDDVFEPLFTFHGFRYMEVTVIHGKCEIYGVFTRAIYSKLERCGHFECDNPLVNKIYENVLWSQKSNSIGIPTDCPQRDERLGWTGDVQIFCETAMLNANCKGFYENYLYCIREGQRENGAIPVVIPDVHAPWCEPYTGVTGWSDVCILLPYRHYMHYGDASVLRDCFEMGERYLSYCAAEWNDYIMPDRGFGDWLSIDDDTDKSVLATAFTAYSYGVFAEICRILGNGREEHYRRISHKIKQKYVEKFVDEDGKILSDTQTVYLTAYAFGILGREILPHLIRTLERKNYRLSTGFIGVRYLLPVLAELGRADLAYELLCSTEYPSWGYTVKNGATTIWERWNSYSHTEGFGDIGMNSFNHYSLGSCVEWLYKFVLGINYSADEPAYKKVELKPYFCYDGKIKNAKGKLQTQHGEIGVEWSAEGDSVLYVADIPQGISAIFTFNNAAVESYRVEGQRHIYKLKRN